MKDTKAKKEELEENNTESPTTSIEKDKLDAVRDLLFGQNVKEYREEIQDVKELIEANQSTTDQKVESTKVELLQKLDQLNSHFEEKIKLLESHLSSIEKTKTNKVELANLLKDIASKLESND